MSIQQYSVNQHPIETLYGQLDESSEREKELEQIMKAGKEL